MLAMRYKQSQGDHMLFIKHSPSKEVTIPLVYVDHIIVMGNNDIEIHFLTRNLGKGI